MAATPITPNANGQPADGAPAPPPDLAEVSFEGVERATEEAFINEIRLPRDTILKDHGRSDPSFYEGLRSDEQVQSTFSRRRLSVVAREWKVEPGGDADIDKQAAAHIEAQLKAISWDRITYKMLAGLWPGYAVSECLWKLTPNNGRYPEGPEQLLELRTIKVRRAGRFRWTNAGELRLLTTKDAKGIPMPPRKFWIFTCGADDDDEPYGLGLAYYCYWAIWFKRNAARFWALFLERFALPLPKAVVPPNTSPEVREEIKQALDAFVAGGRLVVTKGVEVSLEQAVKDSGGDFQRFIDIWNAAISKVILTQTMTTDDSATKAGGTVHMQGEEVVVKSDADLNNESFMAGPAAWVTEANFPGAKTPIVSRTFEEAEDLNALADRDTKLSQVGWRRTPESFEKTFGEGYEYSAPPGPELTPAPIVDAGGTPADSPTAPVPTATEAPKIELTGTDLATIYTVNEARGASGPLKLPNSDVNDPDGFLTVAEFRAKRAAKAEVVGEAIGVAQGAAPAKASKPAATFAEGAFGDVNEAIDRLLENDGWREAIGPQVEEITALLEDASSLEEVQERLGELARKDPKPLQDALARVLFAARVSGEEGADVDKP